MVTWKENTYTTFEEGGTMKEEGKIFVLKTCQYIICQHV